MTNAKKGNELLYDFFGVISWEIVRYRTVKGSNIFSSVCLFLSPSVCLFSSSLFFSLRVSLLSAVRVRTGSFRAIILCICFLCQSTLPRKTIISLSFLSLEYDSRTNTESIAQGTITAITSTVQAPNQRIRSVRERWNMCVAQEK